MVPEFLLVFGVVGRFPWAPGWLSYPPGPILGSVFLWLVSLSTETFLKYREVDVGAKLS